MFCVGDKVLALLPIAGNPWQARYHGPYTIERCINDVNYVVSTPDHRKQRQLCHVNMLKNYHSRDDSSASESVAQVVMVTTDDNSTLSDAGDNLLNNYGIRLNNSQILSNLKPKLAHLSHSQAAKVDALIRNNLSLFPDVPLKTNVICHDVDVGESSKVRSEQYCSKK